MNSHIIFCKIKGIEKFEFYFFGIPGFELRQPLHSLPCGAGEFGGGVFSPRIYFAIDTFNSNTYFEHEFSLEKDNDDLL